MPSSNRKTRERQLAKLAVRRAAKRRRKRLQRNLTIVVALLIAAAGLGTTGYLVFLHKPKQTAAAHSSPSPAVACGGTVPATAGQVKPKYTKPPALTTDRNKTYTATVQTSCGTMVMKLDPKVSPNAVNSFVFLAKSHFFDGLIFHRIAQGFVDQGGDPLGSGSGGPGYSTRDIPPKGTKYPLGAVAMAKSSNEPAGTAGSQFFIVTGQQGASLPADYAVIGSLTSGQDVANRINDLPTVGNVSDGMPLQKVYIVSVTIKVS